MERCLECGRPTHKHRHGCALARLSKATAVGHLVSVPPHAVMSQTTTVERVLAEARTPNSVASGPAEVAAVDSTALARDLEGLAREIKSPGFVPRVVRGGPVRVRPAVYHYKAESRWAGALWPLLWVTTVLVISVACWAVLGWLLAGCLS